MDTRTKEQFMQDIKNGNDRELEAVKRFRDFLYWEYGFTGEINENGCDMTGAFIEDSKQVNTGADFVVGRNKLPLEVKTSTGHNMTIYLKVKQVKSYIRQGAYVLYVNGMESYDPAFTLLTPEDLKEIVRTHEKVIPPNNINGGKESFKLDALSFEWRTFDRREKKYFERKN